MIVITIPILSDNYSYLIIDKNNKTCSAVDPASPKEIIPYLEKKKLHLKNILNTHYHSDHTAGNLDLKKKYKCKIFGPEKEKDQIPGIDVTLKENDTVELQLYKAKIIETPGHTDGSVCFQIDNHLFTGDTLFVGRTGRTISTNASTKDLYFSVYDKILSLPGNTLIYPGHDYGEKPTISLKDNIKLSPLLQAKSEKDFIERMADYEANR